MLPTYVLNVFCYIKSICLIGIWWLSFWKKNWQSFLYCISVGVCFLFKIMRWSIKELLHTRIMYMWFVGMWKGSRILFSLPVISFFDWQSNLYSMSYSSLRWARGFSFSQKTLLDTRLSKVSKDADIFSVSWAERLSPLNNTNGIRPLRNLMQRFMFSR